MTKWPYDFYVSQWLWALALKVYLFGWDPSVPDPDLAESIMDDSLIEAGLYLPWVPSWAYPYGYPGSDTVRNTK